MFIAHAICCGGPLLLVLIASNMAFLLSVARSGAFWAGITLLLGGVVFFLIRRRRACQPRPPTLRPRSGQASVRAGLVICKFNHKVRALRADQRLHLEVHAPAEIRWSADDWTTVYHEPMVEIAPGVWAREFPANYFSPGRALRFTYYWPQTGRWEGRGFVISIV